MKEVLAREIVRALEAKNGPTLSIREAMSMTPIPTNGYRMYGIQKGDVTFLAWWKKDNSLCVKIVCW